MKTFLKKAQLLLLLSMTTFFYGQSIQKNFINYQGVATNSEGEIISESNLNIQIALKFGSEDATASYVESHSVSTSSYGVFTILIGNGSPITGDYNSLQWGGVASYITVFLNGEEIGTNELMAVPYAITSGDTKWKSTGDNIQNNNSGNVGIDRVPTAKLDINGDLKLQEGTSVNEISTDQMLAGNSNNTIPTEQAVKAYVDNRTPGPIVFKVLGGNEARKDLVQSTSVEVNIWDTPLYDTRNAFDPTTKRYVIPENGYYYFRAVVNQNENSNDEAIFRIGFSIDSNVFEFVKGGTPSLNVSGIFFLEEGDEVFLKVAVFTSGDFGVFGNLSWFEGYKIK